MVKENRMIFTIMGVNTGVICRNDKFAALALKIKHPQNKSTMLFFPLVALKDFMLALEHRLSLQAQSSGGAQKKQQQAIDSESKKMHEQIPNIDAIELQTADINQRVNNVELREYTAKELVFALYLHSGEKFKLAIHENQIELLVTAIIHAINNSGMINIALSLSSFLDFLPLYDGEFLPDGNIAYDTYTQADWKLALFPHYQLLIYHYIDSGGQQQYAGSVIKTRCASDSDDMASVSRRLLDYSHRLNRLKGKNCKVSVKTLTCDKRHSLTMEQCMRSMHLMQQQVEQGEAVKA
jgi:hypothetical protein